MQHNSPGPGLRPEHREIVYLCALLQQAKRAVSIPNIQKVLGEALAAALLERGTLSGAEVGEIVSGAGEQDRDGG